MGVQIPFAKTIITHTGMEAEEMKKIRVWLVTAMLVGTTPALAGSLDTGAVLGGGLGGALGAALGSELGGRDGAILGGALGGALGVAVTADRHHYQEYGRVHRVEHGHRYDYYEPVRRVEHVHRYYPAAGRHVGYHYPSHGHKHEHKHKHKHKRKGWGHGYRGWHD